MMSGRKEAPDDNGAHAIAPSSSPSLFSTFLVRLIVCLSVMGNAINLYRTAILVETSTSSGASELEFLPPAITSSASRRSGSSSGSRNAKNVKASGAANAQKGVDTPKNITMKTVARRERYAATRLAQPLKFPVSHFLSHIPKTGAEYAAKEIARLMVATVPLPGNLTIASVNKAQRRYNETLSSRGGYISDDPNYDYFHKVSDNHDHTNINSDAYAPPIACNAGTIPIYDLPAYFFGVGSRLEDGTLPKSIKFRCNFWVSEYPYNDKADRVYTIVREPVSHVISQYFHCSEANSAKHSHLMPPIEEWLDAYSNLSASMSIETRPPYVKTWSSHPEAHEMKFKYRCYNPIDSESDYVLFPPIKPDGKRLVLPEDYTYPYQPSANQNKDESESTPLPPRDEATQRIDKQLFDDLKKRFGIIGDMSRMTKTVCAIVVDFTKGKQIPKPCDCTYANKNANANANTHLSKRSDTFHVENLYSTRDHTDKRENRKWYYRPTVVIGYTKEKHSHGVKNHGSQFVKEGLTAHQKDQITKYLRPMDSVMYNVSRAVFDSQVAELEEAHGIVICDDWNRDSEVDWIEVKEMLQKLEEDKGRIREYVQRKAEKQMKKELQK